MEKGRFSMTPKRWLVTALVLVCLVLVIQNSQTVSFNVLFWKISMSRVIAFPLLIVLGSVIGYVLGRYASIGAKR